MKRFPSFAAALCLFVAGVVFAQGGKPEEIDRVVAVVNADAITATELGARMRTVERQLRAQNVQMPPEEALRSQVLERMIIDRAQVQFARESGLRIDDAQIDRAVLGIAQQNRLTLPQLRQRLEQDGVEFASFREDVRGEILIGRLREREVDQRVVISEADIDALLAEQGPGTEAGARSGEFNLGHILLRVPENASAEQIARQRTRGEELLRELEGGADFGRLAASFSDAPEAMSGGGLGWRSTDRLPELFVQAIQRLRPGQVSPLIRSPNGFHVLKVLDRRDAGSGARLGGAPVQQTHARHILIRQTELVPEVEALRRLREIRERVTNGTARFEDMARQYSSDGSASNGGDLGWIYEGDTVPEFARAMDELKPGELSEPVRSPFGWHLIQVLERRTDSASPERVRMQARQVLRERRSDEAYQEWLRQLRDRTYVEYRLE
jgi:peptidyl-prolyl cis-trans isomerase SurA